MVIDDIPTARVHYQWQSTDTAIPGIYRAQAVVLFPGSQPETFPSEETLYVIVHPKL
jgi:K+/H+ antiporter YhaU regulatory subunit KhtT